MSRVRLNFVMGKVRNNSSFGGITDETPITDPVVYQDAFEKINQAVFVRMAMDAPPVVKPAPEPAVVQQVAPEPAAVQQAAPLAPIVPKL